jgi:carbon-monoxide dehydrogenase medium subunit
VNAFEYLEPATVDEALAILAEHGDDARPIAGGTALVNLMKQRLVQPAYLVGLRRLTDLSTIAANGELRLGALCTHHELEISPHIQRAAPVLSEMLRRVANIRVRSMATIGGALAHADPNQDPPPVLIALDARVVVGSRGGERDLQVEALFTGYYETALAPGELITRIVIPAQPAASGAAFTKMLPQTQDDYATVSAAARLTVDGERIADARVAAGSVGETPLRLRAVERALVGQVAAPAILRDAATLAGDEVDPLSDIRGSAAYKRAVAAVIVRRTLEQALARARAGAPA